MVKKQNKLNDLIGVVKRLRNPKNGCPWDIQQTSKSLAKYTLEEAYEVIEAIESNNNKDGFFQFYCELSDQDKDKIFMKGSRESEDQKAGVGNQTIIDGTGKWKKLIGASCVFGIKYVEEVLFSSQNCKFPGE